MRLPMRMNSMCGMLEQGLEFGIAQQQRIAAGEEHVADFGMLLQITERGFVFHVQMLLAYTAHHAAAGAVAAVAGAAISDQEEHAIRITMHEAWHRHVAVFTTRISHLGWIIERLFDPWNDLATDRAIGIDGVDEIEVVRGDRHRQLVAGEEDTRAFFL